MSQPVSATPRPRPQAVTIAGALLMVVAVLAAINAIVGISLAGRLADAAREAYRSVPEVASQADTLANIARVSGIGGGLLYLVGAVGLVILALLDLRGRQPARVVTWVLAGLGVLCCGCGTIGNAFQGAFGRMGNTGNGAAAREAQQKMLDAQPGWYRPVSLTVSIIGVLCLIVVIILLAVPASNAYFKPAQAGWQPPAGGDPAYPTYPGAVSQPGTDQPGGQVGWSQRDQSYPPQPPRDDEPRD